jgi:hypothetical protein
MSTPVFGMRLKGVKSAFEWALIHPVRKVRGRTGMGQEVVLLIKGT